MTEILIDGTYGEGGGQIIRTGMTLSAITQKSFTIKNIRAKREKPGLQPQHLTACLAVKKICHGVLQNAVLKSTTLSFTPREITGGNYLFDVGTAGSVILVAQTIIPILLTANTKSEVRIIGGTHLPKSPSYDYFANVFLPAIAKLGAQVNVKLIRTGFYPKGGGEILLEIIPSVLQGCKNWQTQGERQAIIRIANLPTDITLREQQILINNGIKKIVISEDIAFSPGNAVTAWQGFKGAYVPGERGKRAEVVAQEVIAILQQETAEVDSHLADQLLIYTALAKGESNFQTSKITSHLITNHFVIAKFINRKIELQDNKVVVHA